jgi:hypothetical protein
MSGTRLHGHLDVSYAFRETGPRPFCICIWRIYVSSHPCVGLILPATQLLSSLTLMGTFPNTGARHTRLRPAATACYEDRQHDDCGRRQEKADIQSPTGAEKRVDHHAGENDDERDHQPDTDPVRVNVAGHEPNIKIDSPSNDEAPPSGPSFVEKRSCRWRLHWLKPAGALSPWFLVGLQDPVFTP